MVLNYTTVCYRYHTILYYSLHTYLVSILISAKMRSFEELLSFISAFFGSSQVENDLFKSKINYSQLIFLKKSLNNNCKIIAKIDLDILEPKLEFDCII